MQRGVEQYGRSAGRVAAAACLITLSGAGPAVPAHLPPAQLTSTPPAQRSDYVPTAASAPSTDIFLAELRDEGGIVALANVRRVTDRDGYDNQPAFETSGALLYTSVRDATQADIFRYDPERRTDERVTRTAASEYSATPLPTGDGFSSIHESAGGQQLWRFDADGTDRGGILDDLQPVGYHAWADEHMVAAFVLASAQRPVTLQLADTRTGEATILAENIGRSLHKVPGRRAISFVRKVDVDNWFLEIFDLDSGEYTRIGRTRPGREDYVWLADGRILMGDGAALFQTRSGETWRQVADLEADGVRGISRLAVSPAGDRIALVGERGGQ